MTISRPKHLAGLVLALSVGACSGQKMLSAEDIQMDVANVRALAAATQLLCESYARSESTETFFKTQTLLIADRAEMAARALQGTGGAAEDARRRGQAIAAELTTVCRTLEKDPNAAAATIEHAGSLAKSASELEDALESQQ